MSAVALMKELDVKTSDIVRKLAQGELFKALEAPTEDSGALRVRGKALKDGAEGYIAVKGNAGTVYASVNKKHYVVKQEITLRPTQTLGDEEEVRKLEAGELVEMLQGPRSERPAAVARVRGRALGDGKEGWLTLQPNNSKLCTPYYRCLQSAALKSQFPSSSSSSEVQQAAPESSTSNANSAETQQDAGGQGKEMQLRELVVGEILELMEGPRQGGSDTMWIRVRAEEDGVTGWAAIQGSTGRVVEPLDAQPRSDRAG